MTDQVILIYGKIRNEGYMEEPRCIHVGEKPLAEVARQFKLKLVTVRYWISNLKLRTVEQATEQTLLQVMGHLDAYIDHMWSEATGYMYTTERFTVGGHDFIKELGSHIGKFALIEIKVHKGEPDATPPGAGDNSARGALMKLFMTGGA